MIAAINDASNDDSRQGRSIQRESLKEFQESLLVQEYNHAIRAQFQDKKEEARSIYLKLLDSPLLSRQDLAHLKYSTLKNLASIEKERDSTKDDALRHFAEATELDFLDPSLWYQIGNLALEKNRLMVARQAFERGLSLNSYHLLCRARLLEALVLIGDFHCATELIDQWLSDDPDNPRLTVLRRALDGPEMTLPACEDQSVLKYVKELMQRRASLHRSVVEPAVLGAQAFALAQPSWTALVTQLTAAVEACKQSRALFGQPVRMELPVPKETPADATISSAMTVDDAQKQTATAMEVVASETKSAPAPAATAVPADTQTAAADATTTAAKPARVKKDFGRRAPSARHLEVRSQLETLLTELDVLHGKESEEEDEEEQDEEDEEIEVQLPPSVRSEGSTAPATAPTATTVRARGGAITMHAEVTSLVLRMQGSTPTEWVAATLDAVLHTHSLNWTADFSAKFLHLVHIFPRSTPLSLEIQMAAAELQLDGAAPDASAQHRRILRAIHECQRVLSSSPEPSRTMALRLYWLRARHEIIAGDPDAACRALVALRDYLRESEPGFEVALPHVKPPYNVLSVAVADAQLRKTTDQNQVAIAKNALQTGRAEDVVRQLQPLFLPEEAEAREATYRQTLRIEMLELLARAGTACGAWHAVVLALLRSLEEMKAGGGAAVAVRVAALALGDKAKRGEISLKKDFEAPAHAFNRVVLLLGDVLRLDKFDKATQVELWLALYYIIVLNPEGAKFKARLRFLTHAHDQLAVHQSACRAQGGKLLITLLELLVAQREAGGEEEVANEAKRQLNQCLQCCYGVKLGLAQHKGDELPMGKDELLQLYRFLAPLIEARALKKTVPLKEPFDRIMKVHPQPPELKVVRAELQDFLFGSRTMPPEPLPSTIPEYEFHKNLYWHAGIVGAGTEEILQNDLVLNPDRGDSWYALGQIYFNEAIAVLNAATATTHTLPQDAKYQVEMHHQKALRCFAEALCCGERDWKRLQSTTEAYLLNRIGLLCYLHAKWVAAGDARADLLGKAEAVYTRLSLLVPAATDPDYINSLALRLDSLIMLGKVQRTLQRPPGTYLTAFAKAVEINEPFHSPGDKQRENPQGDPQPLYHLHTARFRLLCNNPTPEITELIERYRFKAAEAEPSLVEDIIAGLKQSTAQHQYWVSSPYKPQYRLARIYSSQQGSMRYEDARNALMVLRKKGAVGAKLWELWHANYQLITVRPGKPFLFIIEKLNTLLLQIAEHLPIKDALEAAALVARTKPLTETMLQALRLYARCIDAQVEILLKEVPEIIRQLNLPSRAPDAPPPAEPPHRYLDKEVRMKELMEVYDIYLTSKSLPAAQNPMRKALQRADRFYSLLDRERTFEDVVRLLEERRPRKTKQLQRKQEANKEAAAASAPTVATASALSAPIVPVSLVSAPPPSLAPPSVVPPAPAVATTGPSPAKSRKRKPLDELDVEIIPPPLHFAPPAGYRVPPKTMPRPTQPAPMQAAAPVQLPPLQPMQMHPAPMYLVPMQHVQMHPAPMQLAPIHLPPVQLAPMQGQFAFAPPIHTGPILTPTARKAPAQTNESASVVMSDALPRASQPDFALEPDV